MNHAQTSSIHFVCTAMRGEIFIFFALEIWFMSRCLLWCAVFKNLAGHHIQALLFLFFHIMSRQISFCVYIYLAMLTTDAVSDNNCSRIVLDRRYVCIIDSDSSPATSCAKGGIPRGQNCTPSAGMDVTVACSDPGAVLYANGMPQGANATLTYPYVSSAISGLYECVGPAGNTSRLVSLQG